MSLIGQESRLAVHCNSSYPTVLRILSLSAGNIVSPVNTLVNILGGIQRADSSAYPTISATMPGFSLLNGATQNSKSSVENKGVLVSTVALAYVEARLLVGE